MLIEIPLWAFCIALLCFSLLILICGLKTKKVNELERESVKIKRMEYDLACKYSDLNRQLEDEYKRKKQSLTQEKIDLVSQNIKLLDKVNNLTSNVTAFPWIAGMMADYLTLDLEYEAKKLDWGCDVKRAKKVRSIREIRSDAQHRIEQAKVATYQLEYLRTLYPALDDILETSYLDLRYEPGHAIPSHDPTRDYLSTEEWESLSEIEKNQLALDRYIASHGKSKWQIGRDYELSVAHEFRTNGFIVDTFGSHEGLEDLGRDLIAIKEKTHYIVQCKYWSQSKLVHEKHIYQLYGTTISYRIEKRLPATSVSGIFVTNITLSPTAKKAAELLNIIVKENHDMVDFPRIKCNIGRDEFGRETQIYHLPMDMQYDKTRIDKKGEFYAFTVAEAEIKGFRHAHKYFGEM